MEQKSIRKKPERQTDLKPNTAGIPTHMKLDFERGSGQPFDDVQVHYNSEKPARFGALAYTQGTQVYKGPGQERYLPHELGHVVQQKADLVRPTRLENGLRFNDDPALERQADHIMERGGVLPFSSGSEAVIQRALDPAGVGIELETQDIIVRGVPSIVPDKVPRLEADWKGQVLINHDKWSVTIDTTPFQPENGLWRFSVEIIVDGTKLKLDPNYNVMENIGAEIKNALQTEKIAELDNIPEINGLKLVKVVNHKVEENQSIWSDDTIFSVQVTCAMPLDKIYDLLDYHERETILTRGSQYRSSLSNDLPERPKDDKEIHAFLLLLAGAFSYYYDPKQSMPIMPRTSLGKIFMLLNEGQRKDILKILENPGKDSEASNKISNSIKNTIGLDESISFNDYKDYLQKLHNNEKQTTEDPIKNHKEPLGIGKLGDRTEAGLDGKGEFPLFEFRKIGGFKLGGLPKTLGEINDELISILKSSITPSG